MNKDVIKLHIAVALMGLAGVIAKFVSWPAVAVSFGRVLFSSAFLLVFMLVKGEKIKLDRKKDYMLIILAGIIMGAHWTFFFLSIQLGSVAIGTITFAAFPLFVTFLEPLIYKERLKPFNVVIAIIMLLGVIITVPEFSLQNSDTVAIIWGMVSAFSYAVLALFNRYFAKSYSGRQVCLYEQGVAAVFLLPFALHQSITFTIPEFGAVIFLGIVCTALAHSLFVGSLKNVSVQRAGIISGMETVYSIVFAAILLGTMITARELVGGVIILGAALYKTMRK